MKYFLEMVEQVKRQNDIKVILGQTSDKLRDRFQTDSFKKDLFFDFAEKATLFVFSKTNTGPVNLVYDYDSPPILDCPFPIIHIELMGNGIIAESNPADKVPVDIISMMLIEQKPGLYFYFVYLRINGQKEVSLCADINFTGIAQTFLDRINSKTIGQETVRQKIKIGTGDKKRFHTINKVIHVCPKKYQTNISPDSNRPIDWSHRWLVRGHWRSIPDKLGKDREGNYTQHGFTWVTEYQKGPETAPLIQKIRLVRAK